VLLPIALQQAVPYLKLDIGSSPCFLLKTPIYNLIYISFQSGIFKQYGFIAS